MTDTILAETVRAVATHFGAASADFNSQLWDLFRAHGLTDVCVGTSAGGSGGSFREAATVVGIAAEESVSLPLAESLVAGWLLEAAGLPLPHGVRTLAVVSSTGGDDLRDDSTQPGFQVADVPHAGVADHIVFVRGHGDGSSLVACVAHRHVEMVKGHNLAGEARDGVIVPPSSVLEWHPANREVDEVTRRLALLRAVMTLGACRRARDLTLAYAQEREQFGRPLARFQAVQQAVAGLVGEISVAQALIDAAVEAEATGYDIVAAAKVAAGRAATAAYEVSHQVHGAIGYTQEHPLHRSTMRLLAWRDEYGTDREWAALLGTGVLERGGSALWPMLTAQPRVSSG